jgi:hypothetical protein
MRGAELATPRLVVGSGVVDQQIMHSELFIAVECL